MLCAGAASSLSATSAGLLTTANGTRFERFRVSDRMAMPSANKSRTHPDANRMLQGFRTLISLPGFPAQVVR